MLGFGRESALVNKDLLLRNSVRTIVERTEYIFQEVIGSAILHLKRLLRPLGDSLELFLDASRKENCIGYPGRHSKK